MLDFSDTRYAHVRKTTSSISENYYISNYENDAKFAVDVAFDFDHSKGRFFIVYLNMSENEYSAEIQLDHNEIRDFKATVSVSPSIALENLIALHDEKVKTIRLSICDNNDERTLLYFDRRLAETFLVICEGFTTSNLTYHKVREVLQSIVDSEHYVFTSQSEINLTPTDNESLVYLLTEKMRAKFIELKYS